MPTEQLALDLSPSLLHNLHLRLLLATPSPRLGDLRCAGGALVAHRACVGCLTITGVELRLVVRVLSILLEVMGRREAGGDVLHRLLCSYSYNILLPATHDIVHIVY